MVRAYWLAVERCDVGEMYLIGSEDESHVHTFRECVEMLIAMSKVPKATYEIDPQYVRPTQVPRLICDASAFVSKTGWKPEIDFQTILSETLDYWRDQLDRGMVK